MMIKEANMLLNQKESRSKRNVVVMVKVKWGEIESEMQGGWKWKVCVGRWEVWKWMGLKVKWEESEIEMGES